MHQANWQVFQESWPDDQRPTREYGKHCSVHNPTWTVNLSWCRSLCVSEILRVLPAGPYAPDSNKLDRPGVAGGREARRKTDPILPGGD